MKEEVSVVGAAIFNEKNEILCVLKPQKTKYPIYWGLPGGQVNEKEDPKEVLIREIKKELNRNITVKEEIGVIKYEYENENRIVHLTVYEVELKSGQLIKDVNIASKWMKISDFEKKELDQKELDPSNIIFINKFKKKLEDNGWNNLNRTVYKIKNMCLIVIFIALLISMIVYNFGLMFKSIYLIVIIVPAYFISVAWSFYFHFKVFCKITEIHIERKHIFSFKYYYSYILEYKRNKNESLFKIRDILSPDLLFADVFKFAIEKSQHFNECKMRMHKRYSEISYFKEQSFHYYKNRYIDCMSKWEEGKYGCELHQEKKKKTYFVIYSNWINVIMAVVLFFIAIILSYFKYFLVTKDLSNINIILSLISECFFIFVLIRLISRAIEIGSAFYNDVVKEKMNRDLSIGKRSTNLKRGNRISLAVHSYLELVLLFGILYNIEPSWISTVLIPESDAPPFFVHCILYSASVSAFNISFDIEKLTLLGEFIHASQVFLSIILVVLSIATYLGLKDEMNEYEKADWENGER
ncbi:NUDIX domain-containing protein [Bacillus thuringiensis]|uniref:NUDIX domain-containing protein n=1 Tax=Bacillus thuringiensis TaxID=1428 RepID=UPI0015CF4B7A|nr:NUDIX domain-containing protein [Bacillus thuringiensis]